MTTKLSEHTPGPWKWNWRINQDMESDCGVYSEDIPGQAVSVCRAPRYETERQWKANARLIAAAPALLEALEEIAAHSLEFDVDEIRYIAKEAIRAAVGAQEENTK